MRRESDRGAPRNGRITIEELIANFFRVDARDREAGHRKGIQFFADEEVPDLSVDLSNDVGRAVSKAPVDARCPQIGGFNDM